MLALSGMLGVSSQVRGQASEVYDYYEYYDVGYDQHPDDDWFFDRYMFAPASFDGEYDHYLDYDRDADRLAWEEPETRTASRGDRAKKGAADAGPDTAAPEASKAVPGTHLTMRSPKIAETPEQAYLRTHKLRRVSGVLLQLKHVALQGTETDHTVVLLATKRGDRRLPVDLGPTDSLQPLNLKKGDRLALEGVVVRLRDRQMLAATQLHKGNHRLAIQRPTQRAQLAALVLGRNALEARANADADESSEAHAKAAPAAPEAPDAPAAPDAPVAPPAPAVPVAPAPPSAQSLTAPPAPRAAPHLQVAPSQVPAPQGGAPTDTAPGAPQAGEDEGSAEQDGAFDAELDAPEVDDPGQDPWSEIDGQDQAPNGLPPSPYVVPPAR